MKDTYSFPVTYMKKKHLWFRFFLFVFCTVTSFDLKTVCMCLYADESVCVCVCVWNWEKKADCLFLFNVAGWRCNVCWRQNLRDWLISEYTETKEKRGRPWKFQVSSCYLNYLAVCALLEFWLKFTLSVFFFIRQKKISCIFIFKPIEFLVKLLAFSVEVWSTTISHQLDKS